MRVTAAAMTLVMVLAPTLSFAQNVPPGAVNIVPDGRTATSVATNGAVGTVTTNTISGTNAFNSFSKFQIGQGATGNLVLPNGTSNLINLINSSDPAVINGVMNSYKDGKIGGNVYFAAPGGFVVGSSGTVNVGSLNVTTPTREFVDGVVSKSGQINQGAVDNLLAGTVPISPEGNVRIRGRVNALDAVRLSGQNVSVGPREASREQAARFASSVNSKGLQTGGKIVVRNGSIQIVAANDAHINGKLHARGGSISARAGHNVTIGNRADISVASRNGPGGSIAVNAGNDIKVAGYGVLSAKSKKGDAGTIRVIANHDLIVEPGATFDTTSAQGNGGLVELSAFGRLNIPSGVKVRLTAPNGKAGTLLIDPPTMTITDSPIGIGSGGNYTTTDVANWVNAVDAGGTLILCAGTGGGLCNGTFTLASGTTLDARRTASSGGVVNVSIAANEIDIYGTIDTRSYSGALVAGLLSSANRASTGNSQSVTLTAPTINIGSTGKIYADVNNVGTSYTAGNITMTATGSDTQTVGEANASASITIGGTMTAANISATATATATSSYSDPLQSMAQLVAGVAFGAVSGLAGGYIKATATAKVTVQSTAHLTATNAISLSSVGSENATDPAIGAAIVGLQSTAGAAVVVGIVNADIATQVASGATISSGNFTATATNAATLNVLAQVVTFGASIDGALAYTTGTVNTKATVDPGVVFNKVGNVTVAAQNNNNFSTSASSIAAGTGVAAVAVAISDVTTNAVANLGASLPQSANAGLVTVYSGSNTSSNAVFASTTIGSNAFTGGFASVLSSPTSIGNVVSSGGAFDSTGAGQAAARQGTLTNVRGGITLALNLTSASSAASITNIVPDANGDMITAGNAPTINSGNVAVISSLTDAGIRGSASSAVNSPDPTSSSSGSASGVSMAVNVDQLTHNSTAYIGSGVTITAPQVGVHAETTVPITITWLDFDSFSAVTSHITGSFGVSGTVLTSYANATFDSSAVAPSPTSLSGAVNYFEITNNTTAWIASGAHINQTGAGSCAQSAGSCWSTNLSNTGLSGAPASISWGDNVTVSATTTTESINVGGNFSWLKFFGTTSGPTGTAIGGSANVNIFNTNTVAGIGAGAVISALGTVNVTATTSDLIYAVAPTSGSGSGLGLNGIASVLQIDNHTSASVSNLAQITAQRLEVDAQQNISSFDVGGGVGSSSATGVGLVVALAQMSTDTNAFIGDNSTVLAFTGASGIAGSSSATSGYVDAQNVAVSALTVGRLTTVAVAAQSANNLPSPTDPPAFISTKPNDATLLQTVAAFFVDGGIAILLKLTNTYNNLTSDVSGPVNGGNVVAGAGSAAVALTSLGTHASISGATLKNGTSNVNGVSVQALNNTIVDTASGSAALSKGAPGTNYAVGLAGAVAVTMSSDMTTANIAQSTVSAHHTTVQALAGGENTSIGLAIAVTGGSANSSLQFAASVSAAMISNGVQAGIDGSTVGQTTGSGVGDVSIIADQKTNIGIGAGSLYGGLTVGPNSQSTGVGVAMTYASIGDPSSGAGVSAVLSNSTLRNVDDLTVQALMTSRIASGAATVGGGGNANGFAGVVIVNDINPTILAEITGGTVNVSGNVLVNASGASIPSLDALIAGAGLAANGGLAPAGNSGLDFSGAAVSPSNATGAAILAVAGLVQLGKSNVGVSIVVNRIGTSHLALIDSTSVTSSGGAVVVSAVDDAEIIGVAIGVGAATGSIAGNGSVAYNAINNAVVAQIGHGVTSSDPSGVDTATVDAAAVAVTAQDSATIRGAAGAISVNFGGANAVGLSASIDQIATYVSASILGATVTADNAMTDTALVGGNLQAGSVIVGAASTADIISVAIGAAMSVGNSSPQASPQANLASLVQRMAPTRPTSLVGYGGGGITPPTQPQPPSTPQPPSNGLAGAGSLAMSTESTTVISTIDQGGHNRGSTVSANNNVVVSAANTDTIAAYAGAVAIAINSGKGIGASVVVNTINGMTSAGIANSTVDAHAAGSAATIDNGMLATDIDPSAVVNPGGAPSLADGTTIVQGVAVAANSQQTAKTISLVAAASTAGLAISASAVTNIMGGLTQASIQSSSINTNLTAGQVSAVSVLASSASFSNNLDLGISGSGSGASGTAALVINMMDRVTYANINTTNIGSSAVAAGAVSVFANAFQGTATEVVGAAGSGSSGALAGSALTNQFQASTIATFDHGTTYASSLSVIANGKNGFFGALGAGAAGSTAGIGATVLVALFDNTVTARVGDRDASTAATTIHLTGALSVLASNTTDMNSYAIVGALGGTAGIAAQFSGIFVDNNVSAELDNATVTITSAAAQPPVTTVVATETDSIAPVVGGLSGGGTVGVGAAVNLVMLNSSTAAQIAGSTLNTPGGVAVNALSTRDVNPVTVVASLSGQVGLAGTVGIVGIGSGATTEDMSVLNSGANSNDPNSGTLGNAGAATGTNLIGMVSGGVDGISAQILSSNVTASSIGVGATARTSVQNAVGALAIGVGVTGEGAAVAITEVDQQVTAKTSGGTLTAPMIMIQATAGNHGSYAASSIGAAGAGGFYVGMGAAVGKAQINNTVLAELGSTTNGGSTGLASGSVSVAASDNSTANASGYGLGVGLGAVGLSLATATRTSSVTADIAAATTVSNFEGVTVIASTGGGLSSNTVAGAAGILSGAGASATSTDGVIVLAKVGAGAIVTAGDAGLMVSASAMPVVSSSSIGVAAGNVGIGASVAMSNVDIQVNAFVDDNSTISGGPLSITASALVPTSEHSASASAVGSGGGMMLGLQATYVQASNTSRVNAYGGKNLHLPTADVTIAAENDTNQYASGTGVAAGYIGAGATVAETSSDTRTNAYLDTGAVTNSAGALSITATGTDSNTSNSIAGSGGFVAGAAAVATTSADNITTAELRGGSSTNTLYLAGLGINAQHTATYAANGDAYQAAAVGASGGQGTNTVTSTVNANVGPNLIVHSAGGNMNVIASDSVNQTSGGARAGSGGVLAGAATLSKTTVTQAVNALIGNNTILSLDDNPATSIALINIEAYNFLNTTDTVMMDVGGLFAGGGASSTMDATTHNTVTISDGVRLFSAGGIAIGTAANMTANNNADANFYGLVSGGSASANAVQTAYQAVNVGAANIQAWGLINIYAGQSGDGSYTTKIKSNGTTVVYNYTVSSIVSASVAHWGGATANSYSSLNLATGSAVLGANNVFLGADPGAPITNGSGSLYSPFLSIFSSVDRDNRSVTPITSGDVMMDGLVAAGIHNQQIITISYGGQVTYSSGGSPCDAAALMCALSLVQVSDPTQFNPIVSYNNQTIQYALVPGFNPKQDVLNQIASLSGLTVSQVQSAVAAGQSIAAVNDDAAGTKQRQIQTYLQQLPYMSDQTGAAYAFGNILGSAGNVSILATTLHGDIVNGVTPTVMARDSAKISIDNQGLDFLFTSQLTLSSITGGNVNFLLANESNIVRDATHGITILRDQSAQTPTISLTASWSATNDARQPVDQNGNVLTTTPDIYLGGTVTNVSGLLNIVDQLGNVLITRDVRAGTVVMTVPNGLIGGNLGANSVYNTNYDVAAQWTGVEYRPTDVLTAVYAAATYLGMHGTGDGTLAIGGNGGMFPYYYYTNQQGYSGTQATVTSTCGNGACDASTVFTARMLAAYYDGAHNSSPSLYSWIFLPVGEGVTPSSGGTAASWVRNQYLNQAYSGDSGPINYAGGGNFFQVVQIQNQVVNGVQAQSTASAGGSLVTAGKALILSASAINVNGTLEVGQSSNYSVNIGSSAQTQIAWINADPARLAAAQASAAAGKYYDLTNYISTVNANDVKVTASYDALTNQILLNPVVQGTGGYVYLNGTILSTLTSGASQGNIIVHGGAGTVTVNNTTGTTLVTNTINTGVSAASVVQIVDHALNQTKWYVYNAGAPANQQVTTYVASGISAGSYAGLQGVTSANSGLTYQPGNLLYQWTDSASLSRTATNDMSVFGWHFDQTGSVYQTIDNYWSRSAPQIVAGTQSANFQESVWATGSYTGYQVSTGSDKCCGTDFHGTWYQERFDHLQLVMTNSVKANYAIGISFTGGGTSNIAVTSNASVIVNASINNLQGNTAITTTGANSAIVAGAAPFVSGVSLALNGQGGVGTVAAPIPIATYGGTFSASSIDRDIAVNAAGALNINQVSVNPSVSGNAPRGDVYITAAGDITAASAYNVSNPVISGRSITINTSGGAIGARTTTDSTGLVLANINPIGIQATGTALSNGNYDGGLLNSTSENGTYLVQSSGDLRIGQVTSHGAVFLAAMGSDGRSASILNGVATGGLTADQSAYLASVWANLNLLGTGTAGAVTSYQAMINAAYNDYWQLRNMAFAADGTYSITPLGAQTIAAQLAAKLGVDPSHITTAQIETEAMNRFAKDEYLLGITAAKVAAQLGIPVAQVSQAQVAAALPVSLDVLFGTSAGQTSQFQWAVQTADLTAALAPGGFSDTFSYTLPTTSALYASLTSGSRWTLDQLTYTVSPGANPENGVSAPAIGDLPLNVSGRQVMLYSPNGNIGSLATPVTFSFRSDNASNLTDAQKALLASAGPGQLSVTTAPVAGAGGVSQYTVTIQQQSLLMVNAVGPVSAKALAQVYLGSAGDMSLGGIPTSSYGPMTAAYSAGVQTTQPGQVRLQAHGSILGGTPGQVAISGNIASLTLIADAGSIGQAPTSTTDGRLLLALTGSTTGVVDQVQARQGVYLRQTTGDLILGNVNAADVQFSASGSIYAEAGFTDRNAVHIVASLLDLQAGGSISFNGASFQPLQLNVSGPITGAAVGAISLLSLRATGAMIIGTATGGSLTAGGALTLNSVSNGITINGNVQGGGAVQIIASGAILFGNGVVTAPVTLQSTGAGVTLISSTLSMGNYTDIAAAGAISVTTTGDATLGRLTSALATGDAITIVAGGPSTTGGIFANGDGRANLVATGGSNADVSLNSSGAIGTSAAWLQLSAPLARLSGGADVYLISLSALHITSAAAAGSFMLYGQGALTLDPVTVGTQLSIASSGTLTLDTVSSGGSQNLHAAGGISFTSLTATGISGANVDAGDIVVTSDNGSISGRSVEADGSVTLTAGATLTGTTLTATNGLASLTAAGLLNWTSLTAATTLGARSTAGALQLGSTSSGGTQTLRAANDVTFSRLTTNGISGGDLGDINVTSDSGAITGGTVSANGSATLVAATTMTGTALAATLGLASLTAAGVIDWTSLTAATTLGARSTAGALQLGSASSGGTQTLRAANDVTFSQLTTNGISGGDVGDINVTSDSGAVTGGTVSASGSATLIAATTLTGSTLAATHGSASLTAGGLISWTSLTAGTTLGAGSTAGAIQLGSTSSGGTQMLRAAHDVTFAQLTTTGMTGGDVGDINVTSDNGAVAGGSVSANGSATLTGATTLTGTTLAATHGLASLTAGGLIDWTSLIAGTTLGARSTAGALQLGTTSSGGTQTLRAANDVTFTRLATIGVPGGDAGDINVTSDQGAITGSSGGSSVAANGSVMLTAATTLTGTTLAATTGAASLTAGGLIDWTSLTAGTTLGVNSTGATIQLGSASSGGTQTLRAAQAISFAQLTTIGITGDVGNINVRSDNASITGTGVSANGSANLAAATMLTGTTLTAATGSASLTAGGLIDWTSLTAGVALAVNSTGAAVQLGAASSGGTQTLHASQGINFTQLTTIGTNTDAGDINVTSDNASIGGGSVSANGAATLTAGNGDNTGDRLTAAHGDAVLFAGGLLRWNNIQSGGRFGAVASSGPILLGTEVSAGSQVLLASGNITFDRLQADGTATDPGAITIHSLGGHVFGKQLIAHGGVGIASATDIDFDLLQGDVVALATPRNIAVRSLKVGSSLQLAADKMDVAASQLVSPTPLQMMVTGFGDNAATSANLSIDTRAVTISRYRVVDSTIATTAQQFVLEQGSVDGHMLLAALVGLILLDNRSLAPVDNVNVQLYQRSHQFTLSQLGRTTISDAQVVWYDPSVASIIINYAGSGGDVTGTSFIRNAVQDMRQGGAFDAGNEAKGGLATLYLLGPQGLFRSPSAMPVEAPVGGPAVNLGGRPSEKRRPVRDRRASKPRPGNAHVAFAVR
ncbi:leukotoxin LktA family filamentous adhesin [Rubrivivax sp. JA1024]|nr:leukotoxin LktA family filamentous adhesin [Rubrivivax sp. JA1024]